MWSAVIIVISYCSMMVKCENFDCHDDPTYNPEDGPLTDLQFTWLGVLQYIHVKTGNPHYFRSPRVILVTKRFVMSTAVDAAEIPLGYALGNIAFGDYERDEGECGLKPIELENGVKCEPAILLMPIADVLLHPEYKHFGVKTSLALLKLVTNVRSYYMVPACLPFKNYLMDASGKPTDKKIIHLDYTTDVPRDFTEEDKEVSRINLLPKVLCPINRTRMKRAASVVHHARTICTTGCGLHSGAPSLVHEHTGHWSVVALATGGSACPDPLRRNRPMAPPNHITVYPYVPWITAAITGRAVGAFAKDDPFGYIKPREATEGRGWINRGLRTKGTGWVGHWWMGGIRCYDRGQAADHLYRFYHEVFTIMPETATTLTYYLEIIAPRLTRVVCVKVNMPTARTQPKVWELNTNVAKLRIPLRKCLTTYRFQVEAWGLTIDTNISSESSEGTQSSGE